MNQRNRGRKTSLIGCILGVMALLLTAGMAESYMACTEDCSGGMYVYHCTVYDDDTHEELTQIYEFDWC